MHGCDWLQMLPGGQLLASGDELGELAVKDLRMLGQSSSAASKQTVWSQKGGYASGLGSGISCLAIGPKPSGTPLQQLPACIAFWQHFTEILRRISICMYLLDPPCWVVIAASHGQIPTWSMLDPSVPSA